ncbi:hypothetical protein Gpo141_00006471 [Globisporangium polare]
MEGFILAVSPTDKSAKKVWQTVFLKFDEISAKLVAFTDRSQYCVQWSLSLVGADIATPVPGEPNHGVSVDDTPFCFYVRNSVSNGDECHYFAAASDEIKKQWMRLLLQSARDGPRTPRFANLQAESEFSFQARVVKFRVHDEGKHAEYLITCSCQLFSKMAARRLAKQWDVWHRFSDFDALNEALKLSLGPQMAGIDFVKSRRDALRSLFGSALEHEFLEERRLQLDSYVTRVCELTNAVDFFKHHADANLKKFFCFDEHCQNVDESPRKPAKVSRTKEPKASKRSEDASNRQSVDDSSRASDTESASEAQKDMPGAYKHIKYEKQRTAATKTKESKSSDKRERRASKKQEKKNRLKGDDALSPRHDLDVRSASPTSAH